MTNPEEFARLAAVDGDGDLGIVIVVRLNADDSIALSIGVAGRGDAPPVAIVQAALDAARYQVGCRGPDRPMRTVKAGGN
jgi:hypothetical protein